MQVSSPERAIFFSNGFFFFMMMMVEQRAAAQASAKRERHMCWNEGNECRPSYFPKYEGRSRQGTCTSLLSCLDGVLNQGLFWLHMQSIWSEFKNPGTSSKVVLYR